MSYQAANRSLKNQAIAKWAKRVSQANPQLQKDNKVVDFGEKQKQSNELRNFARSLFQQWDSNGFGKLKIIELTRHFIQLGLAANEEIACSFFRNLLQNDGSKFSNEEILQQEVNVDSFLSLFKSKDVFSERILRELNKEVREKREANEKRARDKAMYKMLKVFQNKLLVGKQDPHKHPILMNANNSRSSSSISQQSKDSSEGDSNWH